MRVVQCGHQLVVQPRLHARCVFRSIVTAGFGIVTGEFGIVTAEFGIVTEGLRSLH